MNKQMVHGLAGVLLGGVLVVGVQAAAPELTLAERGRALHAVAVGEQASERTREAAETLAQYLGRMCGGDFQVERSDGIQGIAVGVFHDFPRVETGVEFAPDESFRREEYVLQTHPDGVWLIGATEIAVEHAVWDFLCRLGYRQFFPGETWEVVPQRATLSIALDSLEKPDFYTRRIWYGHGLWGYNTEPYRQWCARNRAVRGFGLATSHCYQRIIRRNKNAFEAHPEYLGLVDGERKGNKLCIANPELRRLVVEDYALRFFRDNPDADCVSLEPSDGGGWCECGDCRATGSPSDRAVLLANAAAEAIVEEFGDHKYVGLLAYNQHSPPPAVSVHPNVLVKVQTAFLRGGYTVDELMQGWQQQGAILGVGDYYSVFLWDKSRPASQRGSDLVYIRETIPRFYRQGARLFMSESSDLWGGIGLGHYLAARLLWDVEEADRADAIVDDFLERAFDPAREPMEGFFRLIYRFQKDDRHPLIRADMLARMYRLLADARKLAAGDQAVNRRLDHLLLYARYEDLFQRYQDASGDARQAAVDDLFRHTYRMRETMMVHAKPVFSRLAGRDKNVSEPPREEVADETPFSREELNAMLQNGIAGTQVVEVPFEPVAFSDDLVPTTPLKLPETPRGDFGGAPQGTNHYFTWLDEPGKINLQVSGGHIVHYRSFSGDVQVSVYARAEATAQPVAVDDSTPPDGETYPVVLRSPHAGMHRIEVWPPSNRAIADTAQEGDAFTIYGGLDKQMNRLTGYWTLCFYVPRGTKVVGGFSTGVPRGSIRDGDGNEVFDFGEMTDAGYFHATVPEGQDGRLWQFYRCRGRKALLTVPPWFARSGKELLLPREVVAEETK